MQIVVADKIWLTLFPEKGICSMNEKCTAEIGWRETTLKELLPDQKRCSFLLNSLFGIAMNVLQCPHICAGRL